MPHLLLTSLTILPCLLPNILCPAVFKGKPGYYHRLLDIPALCPHLTFSQPWSVPLGFGLDQSVRQREEQKQLVILEVNNVSLSVSQFDLPRPKEEDPLLSSRNRTRCSQRYAAAHCGPVAVRYNLVRMEWEGGVLELSEDKIVVQQGNISSVYMWGEVYNLHLDTKGELEVFTDAVETQNKSVKISVEDAFEFSVLLSNETFTIWNKSDSSTRSRHRPWLHLASFPLTSSSHSMLASSGLLDGLKSFSPDCTNLTCLIDQCPASAKLPACCEWILGHSLLSLPGYPIEVTSNYISFSRKAPCDPSVPFSDPAGCPAGWTRFEYQCYKTVEGETGWEYSARECGRLDSKLAVVVTQTERQFMAQMTNNSSWVGKLSSTMDDWTEDCPVISEAGDEYNISCEEKKSGICRKLSCPAWEDSCCKMTREEAWLWERRVMGRSVVLRPGLRGYTLPQGESSPLYFHIVWVAFVGTLVLLICLRIFTRYRNERRYQAYNNSREKY